MGKKRAKASILPIVLVAVTAYAYATFASSAPTPSPRPATGVDADEPSTRSAGKESDGSFRRFLADFLEYDDDRFLMVVAALDWLGTPYKYAGVTRSGVDCSGFVYAVITECFGDRFAPPRTSKAYAKFGTPLETVPAPGDLLVFGTGGEPMHVGISLGGRLFIHAASEYVTGVIVSSLDERYWNGYFMHARRFLPAQEGF